MSDTIKVVPGRSETRKDGPSSAFGPSARKSTELLKAMLQERGFEFSIDWFWHGRVRFGRLSIREKGINAYGSPPVFSAIYKRSTMNWGKADEQLDRLRTGSAKHLAVLHAITFLEGKPSP